MNPTPGRCSLCARYLAFPIGVSKTGYCIRRWCDRYRQAQPVKSGRRLARRRR